MKALLFVFALTISGHTYAQNSVDDLCLPTLYQPGGDSPATAAEAFSIDMITTACEMKSHIQLNKNEQMHILSYDVELGQMKYVVYDFTAQVQSGGKLIAPSEKVCTIGFKWVAADKKPAEDGSTSLLEKLEFTKPACKIVSQ